jgi:hypothetical protein
MPGINLRPTLRQKKSGSASAFLQEEGAWSIDSAARERPPLLISLNGATRGVAAPYGIENENDHEDEND